ncbi:MAG: alanine--glyoxylate aminotransferase family protein [Anaerolineae bacterium]|nr:alanine--glyoxylate aminotransferase family protein [Anaerolineae bacterium]
MPTYSDLNTSERILMGPGPSMVHPRVLRAMAQPLVGHLDPQFLNLMAEIQELLRFVFQTKNQLTIPISGTGSASMEAALCNFIEPGDEILIGVNGYFGERLCDMTGRYGAAVRRIEKPWGAIFSPDEIETELKKKPAKLVALVHGETSTGAMQPMEGMAEVVHRFGGLLLIDCVTSLGGATVKIDEWQVDIAYSGAQKCLSCPPGISPLTVNERARQVLQQRQSKIANWYLDLTMVEKYWGSERTYHHTAPISMNYALREALRLIYEEGLETRFARHRHHAELLWAGLEELGFSMHVPLAHRLPPLTTPRLPKGLDDLTIRKRLLAEYNLEIAGGLGQLGGKVWRVGLMGYSSRLEHVTLFLAALKSLMK